MNKLLKMVTNYITMRRQLGYKLRNAANVLKKFAAFMEQKKKHTITTKLVRKFLAQRPISKNSRWPALMLGIIRRFAIYLHSINPKTEIPPANLVSQNYSRRTPWIYSQHDIIKLLVAVRDVVNNPWLAETYYTLFGLIAVTGMRTSEAISLNNESVDLTKGIIEIHKSKFQKTRKIPIHITTKEALERYVKKRKKCHPIQKTSAFFVNSFGGRLDCSAVQRVFGKIRTKAGLCNKQGLNPRIMDLRHSFVTKNLLRCYQENRDVDQVIPYLSIYLGHENPEFTYWYLSSTPELFNLINLRAEKKYWRG